MACPDNQFEAVIGEKRFSRVRPVDDEERKKRIFDTYSYCSLDVKGLNKQLEYNQWKKDQEEAEKKAYAEYQDMKNRNMKYYEEQVRLRKKENDLEAAKEWTEQHKERVAQDVAERLWRMQINDRYGPLTRDRYVQQDLEPAREIAIYNKLQEKWCDQIDTKEAQRKKDYAEHMDYIHRQCMARKTMREREEFIGRRLFEDNRELMKTQMCEAGWKQQEAREEKRENHMYQIKPEYFAQFQTRSR
ncbi:hypothetical protein MPTK1_1g23730 [Marchantia polymorpha subsp. ruderalis]|uniref:Uncharacterized protein n=2 Tax=Marchantia polymorpha TaxID=3197 RepID=A0AAF6ATK5_MARPO|nr:hypothetical protein MARPO_0065s0004 [Marchantia polymorpha]PTQ36181.1 hypothetical protein MARPO_0065s0004 [Marchantia polymorpha]BBM99774.1 hypothetical protein Mp_1g23730 [Marchantia polymorpha subsp. ruderalis]BBM99775.1 hypothetical protein Mp_1g23730 [Marchantia polymorpha subsp. ruderalis]|eukprot:PTQ36180.1 hypothetical protein MARPO_0065s0004 [Marchantia polymorpha]